MSLIPDETRTNLMVNYLPQTLTDDEFCRIFERCGQISNFRIMRDLQTNGSLGYGFVEYSQSEDAQKAIIQFNNLQLQHKHLKVAFAQPPGIHVKDTNLYIQNIPKNYTITQFSMLFEPFGRIVQKNLLADKITGMPHGVGFVRYTKKSEADEALKQMNGKVPEGCIIPLQVKLAEDNCKIKNANNAKFQATLPRGKANFRKFRGGKNYRIGHGEINRFSPMEQSFKVYRGTQEYVGVYGSCSYSGVNASNSYSCRQDSNIGIHPDAQKNIVRLNLPKLHEHINVAFSESPIGYVNEAFLYIQNIPKNYTITQFSALFEPFGMIIKKKLLKDKFTGMPKGVGFVRYTKSSEADEAIRQMNGKFPKGGTIPLEVRLAEDHSKIHNEYEEGFQAACHKANYGNFENIITGEISGMGCIRGGEFNPPGCGVERNRGTQRYGNGSGNRYGGVFCNNDFSGSNGGNDGVATTTTENVHYNRSQLDTVQLKEFVNKWTAHRTEYEKYPKAQEHQIENDKNLNSFMQMLEKPKANAKQKEITNIVSSTEIRVKEENDKSLTKTSTGNSVNSNICIENKVELSKSIKEEPPVDFGTYISNSLESVDQLDPNTFAETLDKLSTEYVAVVDGQDDSCPLNLSNKVVSPMVNVSHSASSIRSKSPEFYFGDRQEFNLKTESDDFSTIENHIDNPKSVLFFNNDIGNGMPMSKGFQNHQTANANNVKIEISQKVERSEALQVSYNVKGALDTIQSLSCKLSLLGIPLSTYIENIKSQSTDSLKILELLKDKTFLLILEAAANEFDKESAKIDDQREKCLLDVGRKNALDLIRYAKSK